MTSTRPARRVVVADADASSGDGGRGRDVVTTPDGRYIVVRGRLWRKANPALAPDERQALVDALMHARRAIRAAMAQEDEAGLRHARAQVQAAKVALGERGPVWWDDGTPDLNRHLIRNTGYAEWYAEGAPQR
ncbi:hypothetical protein ACFX59_03885 [Sphingomonas sp. NCPPB 2930]|uniref:hypothetical protein n=1 Tax=Sphingomonas sp. NCPPB 2930 TaxID=3162788 RepID=UPI0036D94CA7